MPKHPSRLSDRSCSPRVTGYIDPRGRLRHVLNVSPTRGSETTNLVSSVPPRQHHQRSSKRNNMSRMQPNTHLMQQVVVAPNMTGQIHTHPVHPPTTMYYQGPPPTNQSARMVEFQSNGIHSHPQVQQLPPHWDPRMLAINPMHTAQPGSALQPDEIPCNTSGPFRGSTSGPQMQQQRNHNDSITVNTPRLETFTLVKYTAFVKAAASRFAIDANAIVQCKLHSPYAQTDPAETAQMDECNKILQEQLQKIIETTDAYSAATTADTLAAALSPGDYHRAFATRPMMGSGDEFAKWIDEVLVPLHQMWKEQDGGVEVAPEENGVQVQDDEAGDGESNEDA